MAAQDAPFLPDVDGPAELSDSTEMESDVERLLEQNEVHQEDKPQFKMSAAEANKTVHCITWLDVPGQPEPSFRFKPHEFSEVAPGIGNIITLKTDRGTLELLPGKDKQHTGDCILVPDDWAGLLLTQSHTGEDRALLTSASCKIFLEFRTG
jgi:hypothetical protein